MSNFRVVRVSGGKRVELKISADQAHRLGIQRSAPSGLSPIYLLEPLLAASSALDGGDVCGECGTSRRDVILHRRVGCEHCYTVFTDTIERLVGPVSVRFRIAENAGHQGRIPKRLQRYRRMLVERGNLVDRLQNAVEHEDYEQAADLRDRIQRMETETGHE